ncbi:DNA-binding transcriptional ArsR family regulator [Azospirillum fermentarium]|uniref:ArsR/SmtB family transcription factor n=1 Tax=Azospirillum fermentarium TaxID=1233114 RepID=UPI0022262BE2|nr:metalloregulator ArsR/SmtB family transcription factor [Azospirillum fermentarium]MCW2248856.1 DNA-binding transcriptional ArsR family regulator [Azospirillum fermentarium]
MNTNFPPDGLRPAVRLLKALSSEPRLMILCELGTGERSVGELVAAVGLSQSALSQHLARLRADGLVRTRRQSQTIYYAVASREAADVIAVLAGLFCPGKAGGQPERTDIP